MKQYLKPSISSLLSLLLILPAPATASVKTFDKHFSVALVSVNHNYKLSLASDLENIDSGVDYRANTSSLSGVEVSYKLLTIAYLTSDGFTEEDISQKGETSYEDLRGGLFLGKDYQWVVLGYYNRYKGMYIENTEEIDPLAALYLKRSDIEAFNAGGAVIAFGDAVRLSQGFDLRHVYEYPPEAMRCLRLRLSIYLSSQFL